MPELGSYGSVRGAAGNSRPYRERLHNDPTPDAPTAGVRKAPMDEIARGARLRCRGLYEGLLATPTPMTDGMSRDKIDGALKRVMPSPVWSQRAADTTRACWYGS
jgi:hypothetical protein